MANSLDCPKLRAVEVVPRADDDGRLVLRDPTGLAEGMVALNSQTLYIVSLMTGRHSRPDIQAHFTRRFGRMLFSDELDAIVRQLDAGLYLDSPRLTAHKRRLRDDYRAAAFRPLRDPSSLAPDGHTLDDYLDSLLTSAAAHTDRVAGFVAPHLDYPRGGPCYVRAYRDLAARTDARRFILLGTNHFGETASVVGTRKDFETPWGVVPHDAAFMDALNAALGADLCTGEFDHVREHSVELQVVMLKRVLRDRQFTIVPILCPDPCGATGTRPRDGHGPDLRKFAEALGALIAADSTPTCIIAGADLSHVGAYFHDPRPLDPATLAELRASDLAALRHVESGDPEAFRQTVASTDNSTNICSVGCIYALATALAGRATPRLRHYHQAVTHEIQNCVTCAAMDFVVAG